ncbi:MAG: PorT family protein [Fibrobacter sp.]|nr:PorT family protein [Fibrobacter sp.]
MNLKYVGIVSALALSAAFAQETAAPATEAAPAAEVVAPAEVAAPAVEPAVAPAEAAPVAAPAPQVAEPVAAPAPQEAESADVAVAPKAVRGEDAAPAAEVAEPVAAPAAEPVAAPAPQVAEPVAAPAPKAVRGEDDAPRTVYYETVYTREDGTPVRTVYVAQHRSSSKDTVSMDQLMGLVPMQFKIGAHGSIGSYYLTGDKWDDDDYYGISWRAGLMSIIPLNDYTMGIKLGVIFERSKSSETYDYYDNNNKAVPVSFNFDQMKVNIPVLFTFKGASSNLYFDLGAQISIPVKDELKVSYKNGQEKIKETTDLMDEDYRTNMDWSLVFGFSVMAHKRLSIDVKADVGLSDLYEGYSEFPSLDLSCSSFGIGLTLYPF